MEEHKSAYKPPVRGVHIDCKTQMMRFDYILDIFNDLARWGYNTVLIEYQDRFPFDGELGILTAPEAFTRGQITLLHEKAAELGLSIIPLVQCLGHMYWAARHQEFQKYGEGWDGEFRPDIKDPEHTSVTQSFCPSNPEAFILWGKIADQVISLHPGCRYFHMGGDEVRLDFDCPRCGGRLSAGGGGRLLAEYYQKTADWVKSKGLDPIMWCDMLLAYPDTIGDLKGRVIIMDWDYWSLTKPQSAGVLWGCPGLENKPDEWPDAHRKMIMPYFYNREPDLINPFPYTGFLKDQGFLTITAPAARCAGDSFLVPMEYHTDNAVQAVRASMEYETMGFVVTSWAVRRGPWPFTERTLIAASLAMGDPSTPMSTIDEVFANEHFGAADAGLGRVAAELGIASRKAVEKMDILSSAKMFDMKTGRFYAKPYEERFDISALDRGEVLRVYSELARVAAESRELLDKAVPENERQRHKTELWRWASDMYLYFADFAPVMFESPGSVNKNTLARFRERISALRERGGALLGELYTEEALLEEDQARFGVHICYLEGLLEKTAERTEVFYQ